MVRDFTWIVRKFERIIQLSLKVGHLVVKNPSLTEGTEKAAQIHVAVEAMEILANLDRKRYVVRAPPLLAFDLISTIKGQRQQP